MTVRRQRARQHLKATENPVVLRTGTTTTFPFVNNESSRGDLTDK